MRRVVENMVVTLPFGLILAYSGPARDRHVYTSGRIRARQHTMPAASETGVAESIVFRLSDGDLLPALEPVGHPDLQTLGATG